MEDGNRQEELETGGGVGGEGRDRQEELETGGGGSEERGETGRKS